MREFTLEKNFDLLITIGFNTYILYASIDLFQKIKDRKETILELDTLRYTVSIVLGLNIFLILGEFAYLLKSKKKDRITSVILTLIDLVLTSSYLIILQHLEDFYKAKNYDESIKYAKILIGLDSGSILLSFVNLLIDTYGLVLPELNILAQVLGGVMSIN